MKMKRRTTKNGFTLIELLAVIVILAIIALIAVPVILNIIDKANKSAFKDTAYGVISAGELYFAEQQLELEGMKESKTFEFPNATGLEMKGKLPESGWMKVNTEGKVSLSVSNGRYCVTKGFEDKDVTVTEGECTNETKELAIGDPVYFNPNENRICDVTTEYTEANSATGVKTGCMRWYVYKEDGDNVGLILDHNTTALTKWNETGNNVDGPTTLNAVLKADTTDQGWKVNASVITIEDLMNMLTWYQDLEDKTTWESQYGTYMSAALDTVMATIGANASSYANTLEMYKAMTEMLMTDYSEIALPRYLHEDLYGNCDTDGNCTTSGYWTSDAIAADTSIAWVVVYSGISFFDSVGSGSLCGLRPVITLSKSLIS